MMLISEQQVTAENIVVLGISADGNLLDIADIRVMQGFIEKSDLSNPAKDKKLLAELNKLTPEERFALLAERTFKMHQMLCMPSGLPDVLLHPLHC